MTTFVKTSGPTAAHILLAHCGAFSGCETFLISFLGHEGKTEMHDVRVLVVDDFQPWRDFARRTLEKMPGLLIVAEATDGLEAVKNAEEHQPDLVILDIALPKLNGFEVARQIRRTCRTSRIVFLTAHLYHDVAEVTRTTGVSAYVQKSRAATELIPAVEAALNGGTAASQPTQFRILHRHRLLGGTR
jgi:DNA-binding NarL/FixJ family response regulator